MNSKRNFILASAVVSFATAFLATSPVSAQTEIIGTASTPVVVPAGGTVAMIFTNFIPPHPDHKEFEFLANAMVAPGAVGTLQVDFDYVDASGATIIVPAPNWQFLIIGGQNNPINSGILTLPFCPQIVSLHLTNLGPVPSPQIDVVGTFRHECMTVPEPSSLLLAGLGLLGLGCVALRKQYRRARNSPAVS